jgi:XRE family aerobic/anaerobic benzoate catabolism transcriptional regulator
MSRRDLAEAAGVSDRYVAQLESGRGNMSILLLRRLAHALDIPLERLLPDDAPPPS